MLKTYHKENSMRKIFAVAAVALALVGCANPSTNMRIGNEQSYISLQAQREAILSVAESESLPPGAASIGPVDASRCHRVQGDIEPSKEILMGDLKAAAYARGADGVYGVTFVSEMSITRNCWYIITARAMMYRSAK